MFQPVIQTLAVGLRGAVGYPSAPHCKQCNVFIVGGTGQHVARGCVCVSIGSTAMGQSLFHILCCRISPDVLHHLLHGWQRLRCSHAIIIQGDGLCSTMRITRQTFIRMMSDRYMREGR